MPFIPLSDPDQLPLDRHLLIEAGAGTGKTYTLESLVVRLLKERADLSIENILVVTFTEKATSELKMRIRRKLSQMLAQQDATDPARRNLTRALDNFDQAAVYTIHGFCQTLLGDLAFENRVLFEHELVDDGPLLEELLQEDLRGYWPARFGEAFSEVLVLSAFGADPRRFEELVLKLARNVRQAGGYDRLRPDLGGLDYDDIREGLAREITGLKEFMGPAGSLAAEFGRLNIHASSRKGIITKIITPLEDLIHEETASVPLMVGLREWLARTETVRSQGRKGMACLISDQWTQKGANPEAAPRLAEQVTRLNRLGERLQALTHWLTQAVFARLCEGAAALKRQKGLMSYDDMLSGLARALSPVQSGNAALDLARQIRGRFPVAFVDEFQDTDPVQWQIFKTLYLNAEAAEAGDASPRLVLIGDPKQAIYAFRGADIYTYLQARQEMEALARERRAGLYSLAVNWRSAPELVEGFNGIFGAAGGWFEESLGAELPAVGYQPLKSAGAAQLPQQLQADAAGGSALNLVDLEDHP
ncbi:MAG: UvrD-helicase domain-containing protein, partial [Desulfobacterales bacterium]